ncbi:histone h1-binding protein [Stagonosporopsis vannaccii]|nr:histone h1-binding protein [Stagonosporopsis vannaccii]
MAEPTNEPLATVAETEELPKTKEKLDELTQAASLQYSLKNFSAAADHYADAVEIQAELNGEMAPENAELLFYYGRALYKVAVAKSDVLGNKVAQEDQKKKKKAKKEVQAEASASAAGGAKTQPPAETNAPKPASTYFQLTGDENWDDSDDEDEDEADAEQDEEEDDFANAYETFELARVLYQKQLDTQSGATTADKGKGPAVLSPTERSIKEKIADCHGFLVEISLENERFHDAVADARSSLALQEELNPFEHENVTESHYSLSLALEFASVSKIREDQAGAERQQDVDNGKQAEDDKDGINWDLRNEAAKHTDLAIQSLQARLKKEEVAIAGDTLTDVQKKEKRAVIEDKKAMLEELQGRLKELKLDPTKHDYDSIDQSVVQGLFGSLLGADKAKQQEILKEASAKANDVSQVVRKKAKPAPAAPKPAAEASGSGKRKLDVEQDAANGKRSKTEEPA